MAGTTKERLWTCALLPVLLLPAGAAGAEPAAADEREEDKATLEEYVRVDVSAIPQSNTIGTKLPVDLQHTPAIVGTVSSELFREQRAMTLSDTLKNVSGLNIQAQNGISDFFFIRAYDSLTGSLVMIDGAPVPEATIYPTYNIEGVEVLKGPGGYLYGGDPLAGAVNLVRKQPVPNDFLHGEVSTGSFDSHQGALDWNTSNDNGFAFRLNGFYRESDGYRDYPRQPSSLPSALARTNEKASAHWALNPSFNFQVGERGTLNVNLEAIEADYSPDGGLPLINGAIPDVEREHSYQSRLDFSEQSIQRVQVDYQVQLDDRVTLRNKVYFRDFDWLSSGTLVGQDFSMPATPVSRTVNTLDNEQRFVGNQLEAVFRLGQGQVKHSLLAGVELARRDNDFAIEFGFLASLALDASPGADAPASLAPFQSGTSESTIVAPYIVDQIEFSPRFHLMLGVRYDDIDFKSDTSSFGFPATATDRSDGDVSPRAGFVWAPSESLSVYANAGESFAPPSARVVGPQDAQESDQVELGVKTTFLSGKLRTTFAVYELNRKNLPIPDDNQFTEQQGDQESRGFEFELAAEPVSGVRTFFSYAYTDAELTRFSEEIQVGGSLMMPIYMTFDRAGNTPAFAAKHLANLWVSSDIGRHWGVGGGARFIGDQFIAEDNGFELDSATVFDATVFYRIKGWRASLNFKNLTDEEYEMRGFGSRSVIPADPRALYATVAFEL